MEFTQMNELNVTSYTNYRFNQRGSDTIHSIILKNIGSIRHKLYWNMWIFWMKYLNHTVCIYTILHHNCKVLKYL